MLPGVVALHEAELTICHDVFGSRWSWAESTGWILAKPLMEILWCFGPTASIHFVLQGKQPSDLLPSPPAGALLQLPISSALTLWPCAKLVHLLPVKRGGAALLIVCSLESSGVSSGVLL